MIAQICKARARQIADYVGSLVEARLLRLLLVWAFKRLLLCNIKRDLR